MCDSTMRVHGRSKLVSIKQARVRNIGLLSKKRDLFLLAELIMQMVRYHSRPKGKFPDYQINFVLHTFLAIINHQPQQNMELGMNMILI